MTEEWKTHFETQYFAQQREMHAMAEVMDLYEKLRKRDLARQVGNSIFCSPSEATSRLESALLQKSRQIESQQSLLSDLQAQLSLKESEVRDLNKRLATSISQHTQLRSQLEATHALLQEKELEIVRLRTEIRAMEDMGKMEIIETLHDGPPKLSDQQDSESKLRIPHRMICQHKLTSPVPPVFITSGPQTVVVGSDRIFSFNAVTGGLVSESAVVTADSGTLLCGAISPENDSILVGSSESQLSLIDFTGRLIKDLKGHGGKVKSCGFLGSKAKAFSVASDRTIKLWDLTRASPIRSVPVTSQLIAGAASSDGTMMVTAHLNGKVSVWSMQDKICEIDAHSDTCLGVSISPDGRFITSIGKDDTVAIIDIHMAQTGPIHTLTGFKALAVETNPACSRDSRIVSVSGAKGIYSWDLILGTPLGLIHTDCVGVAWVPGPVAETKQSQQLVSIHANGTVKWWSD
jgi:WD40 repeat protein